jgi:SAM-dependent methyltransferase
MSNQINKLVIDSTQSITDLCMLGAKYRTDKSPISSPLAKIVENPIEYAHAYTSIYDFLFSPVRYKKIKFGEIGVQYNHSIKCFREYFPEAEIHGFDHMTPFLEEAKKQKLHNTHYHWLDSLYKDTIINAMEEAGGEFDIIIEDSSHQFDSQINFIELLHPYLKPGGILVIEDLYPDVQEGIDYAEEKFTQAIKPFRHHYSNIMFIEPKHQFQYSGLHQCDKLLILYK